MPFAVYIVPAGEVVNWGNYIRSQKDLSQIFNCVYLLWKHDFIYAGKSINGDRILGHVADGSKEFDYQLLFVPNNENASTMMNWTSGFMSYLESLMIERLSAEANSYCKNVIAGKNPLKSHRDLNLNEDKEAFANNVVDLIFEAFRDITYCDYLVPERPYDAFVEESAEESSSDSSDEGLLPFWKRVLELSDSESKFHQLVKPRHRNFVYRNMDADKLIANANIRCVIAQSTCRVELVGWRERNSEAINLEVFDQLKAHRAEIEKAFGCALRWDRKEGNYTTNISLSKELRYDETSIGSIRDITDFFTEYFDKFYTIMPQYCSIKEADVECYDIDR